MENQISGYHGFAFSLIPEKLVEMLHAHVCPELRAVFHAQKANHEAHSIRLTLKFNRKNAAQTKAQAQLARNQRRSERNRIRPAVLREFIFKAIVNILPRKE